MVSFQSQGGATQTVLYPFGDFHELVVQGPFEVTVRHAADPRVALTVDAAAVPALDVHQQGAVLHVGLAGGALQQVEVLEAVIETPRLVRLSAQGATRCTLTGLVEPELAVELAAAAQLAGADLGIDRLEASLAGASRLELEHVLWTTDAAVQLKGASTATLALESGGFLTGSVTAASSLLYYGQGVQVAVQADATSSVTALGAAPEPPE